MNETEIDLTRQVKELKRDNQYWKEFSTIQKRATDILKNGLIQAYVSRIKLEELASTWAKMGLSQSSGDLRNLLDEENLIPPNVESLDALNDRIQQLSAQCDALVTLVYKVKALRNRSNKPQFLIHPGELDFLDE